MVGAVLDAARGSCCDVIKHGGHQAAIQPIATGEMFVLWQASQLERRAWLLLSGMMKMRSHTSATRSWLASWRACMLEHRCVTVTRKALELAQATEPHV